MDDKNKHDIRNIVRKSYVKLAANKVNDKGCCSDSIKIKNSAKLISSKIGYSDEEISNVPKEANMGLGCGNPQLFSEIKEGETVIDLGSGQQPSHLYLVEEKIRYKLNFTFINFHINVALINVSNFDM